MASARVLVLACAHEDGEPGCHYHTGSEQAARSALRYSGAPWNDGVSVSTDRHAAPPLS